MERMPCAILMYPAPASDATRNKTDLHPIVGRQVLLTGNVMRTPFADVTLLVGVLALVLHVLTCNRSRCPVVRVVAKDRVRETSLHAGSDQN